MQNAQDYLLDDDQYKAILSQKKWPEKNIAFLIVHGIGNQKPIETLDAFSRGILKAFKKYLEIDQYNKLEVEHLVVSKKDNQSDYWFENHIRIKKKKELGEKNEYEEHYIDIYEYYWANLTEDKTDLQGVIHWLRKVVDGALKYYTENDDLVNRSTDKSIFINRQGKLSKWRYILILRLITSWAIGIDLFMKNTTSLIRYLPLGGNFIAYILEWLRPRFLELMSNVIGDIAVYNEPNPRSSHQNIRREILNGCVDSLRYLVEPQTKGDTTKYPYEKVVVAAHSLGSEIAFDAMNRLTQQINLNHLNGYDQKGQQLFGKKENINAVLDTFITFGSPLDKTAFFFREQSEKSEYIKKQILAHFHCFKETQWNSVKNEIEMTHQVDKVFKDITWMNYYDSYDYVSGRLDYYQGLTNINCQFKFPGRRIITHSDYWTSHVFFGDVLYKTL